MSTPTLDLSKSPYELLSGLRVYGEAPCKKAMDWVREGNFADCSSAYLACHRPDWLLLLLDSLGLRETTKDRKFAIRCARDTPFADGRTIWDLLADERSRRAIEVAELHVNGQATGDELREAVKAAVDAAMDAVEKGTAPFNATYAAMWVSDDPLDAAWAASEGAAWDGAEVAQASFLREIYGNPFE